jgi:hypothetical protein
MTRKCALECLELMRKCTSIVKNDPLCKDESDITKLRLAWSLMLGVLQEHQSIEDLMPSKVFK